MTTKTLPAPRIWLVALSLSIAWLVSAGAPAEEGTPHVRPKTYGTSQDSIYHVPATEFLPRDSNTAYTLDSFPGVTSIRAQNCLGYCFMAIPRLPSGALLTGIEAYFCNTDPNSSDALTVDVAKSLYDGTGILDLGGVGSETHNGCGEFVIADLTGLNYQVNYENNQLVLYGNITATDGTQAISGVNLFYRLQVSPAPGTADFADVPTSHPFFQFVEALAASGITAGCGNGNYCPDAPMTRGQMAVFLAKALGLQWP